MSEPVPNTLLGLSRQLQQLVESAAPTIVSVRSQGRPVASGIAWKPNVVVTASDALEADEAITVTASDGRTVQAELAGRDPTTDIAILRLAQDVAVPAALTSTAEVGVGQLVLALGRGGDGAIAAFGSVATVGDAWQSRRGGRIDRLVRLDLRLNRQAEGGAIVDVEGRVLGMPVFGPRRKPLLIPMATIERVAPKLLADGRIRRGYLGIGAHPVQLDEGVAAAHALADRRAIMVLSVDPQGPAGKAGVLLGDAIVSFAGEPLSGMRGLFAKLSPDAIDKPVELKILRAGQITSANVTIGATPAS
jgi:S1-C subfamily serine protease